MGAIIMRVLTYIENATNFMFKSNVEENNVRIPLSFGYIL